MGSFNEEDDGIVGRIDPASLAEAAARLGAYPQVDAVFVSCTSLRLAEAAAGMEARIGKPVTSSNHAMLWHALRLAGIEDRLPRWGRLFELGL
jgi:maleate isomerase